MFMHVVEVLSWVIKLVLINAWIYFIMNEGILNNLQKLYEGDKYAGKGK